MLNNSTDRKKEMNSHFPIIAVAVSAVLLLAGCNSQDMATSKKVLDYMLVQPDTAPKECAHPYLPAPGASIDQVYDRIVKSFSTPENQAFSSDIRRYEHPTPLHAQRIQKGEMMYYVAPGAPYYEIADYITDTRWLYFKLIQKTSGTLIQYKTRGFPDSCEKILEVLTKYIGEGQQRQPSNRGKKTLG